MTKKRRFHRVRYRVKGELTHDGIAYQGQLENLSQNGALLSFDDGIIVPQGEQCTLAFYPDGDPAPLRIVVEVIHSGFSMVGVYFLGGDPAMKSRLEALLARISPVPEQLPKERLRSDRDST